ncbi:MAG: hypothetical protein IIX01_04575 [Clostridia bacterium]|nr:hypothetical protein [Clostridia bacterium]
MKYYLETNRNANFEQFFKALNLLKKEEFGWELTTATKRRDLCVKKIWRTFFLAGSLSLICLGLSFLDGLENGDLRYIAVILAVLLYLSMLIPTSFYTRRMAQENEIPVAERILGRGFGDFNEDGLFLILSYSSGLLLYQILVLIFG